MSFQGWGMERVRNYISLKMRRLSILLSATRWILHQSGCQPFTLQSQGRAPSTVSGTARSPHARGRAYDKGGAAARQLRSQRETRPDVTARIDPRPSGRRGSSYPWKAKIRPWRNSAFSGSHPEFSFATSGSWASPPRIRPARCIRVNAPASSRAAAQARFPCRPLGNACW